MFTLLSKIKAMLMALFGFGGKSLLEPMDITSLPVYNDLSSPKIYKSLPMYSKEYGLKLLSSGEYKRNRLKRKQY